MQLASRVIIYWLFSTFLLLVLFSTSSSAQSSSCSPSDCVAQCQPSCSDTEVCVLSTMSSCGQCPASKCMDKSALGISGNGSNNNNNGDQNNENNAELIGGLVGGLVGGGIFIGALAFCIYRYRKTSKSSLPIAFQTTTRYTHQQQQQQQKRSMVDGSDAYPRLSEVPRPMSESTRDSACQSITSGVIPIAYIPPSHHMQQELYQQNQLYRTSSPTTPPNPSATPTTMLSHSTTQTVVANPFQDPRHSQYSINDDDDDDDDMSSRHHSVISTNQQASHHAIQVTRAKPQILRVNTVRVNDLKRGDSVRTILTKSEQQEDDDENHNGLARSSILDGNRAISSTNGDREQDPFQDDRYAVDDDMDDLRSSRPTTNHSLGSTLGDGEITIFWSGQQPSSFASNQQR